MPTMAKQGWFSRLINRSQSSADGELSARPANGQGIYTPLFGAFEPRTFQPEFYESLRESLPILDAMIDRLVTLDGVPVIAGEDAALVDEIQAWAKDVQVNDVQKGLTSFSHAMRNETHEQGFNIPEYVLNRRGNDVVRLNVPDSKDLRCGRTEEGALHWYYNPFISRPQAKKTGNDGVKLVLESRQSANVLTSFYSQSAQFKALDMSNKLYMAYTVENNSPYGVSRLRSMPFVAKAILTIENGITNTHARFGDPSYHVQYTAGTRMKSDALGEIRTDLHTEFKQNMENKQSGRSVDFTTAVDKDSKVEIGVIGAGGEVLGTEEPARHLLEQVVAKSGLPAWLLGLHFSTAERLAKFQMEVLKQESDTRTNMEGEVLEDIIIAMLRARGRTWSDETMLLEDGRRVRRAWRVEFLKPNLADLVAQAQAKFMNAQADAVRANAGVGNTDVNNTGDTVGFVENAGKDLSSHIIKTSLKGMANKHNQPHNHVVNALETRPIENPALDTIEQDVIKGVFSAWDNTGNHIITALGLDAVATSGMGKEGFSFSDSDKILIAASMTEFVADIFAHDATAQGAMAQAYVRAWSVGVLDAYQRSALDAPIGALNNDAVVAEMLKTSQATFETFINNKMTPAITRILEAGAAAGDNPLNIAANLRRELGGAKWKWEQIARSETAMAWDDAKRGEWQAEIADGVIDDLFDFVPAPDGCPQCQAQAVGNPRNLAATPKPVVNTHPSCRCDVSPHI